MEKVMSQNESFNEINKQLLDKMREQEEKLRSSKIQLAFEKEPDIAKRRAFLEERNLYRAKWMELETKILKNHAKNLKSLAPDLENAIEKLEVELQNVKNTVAILSTINRVTSIVARIVPRL
ncbi:hypothetical protein SAMD00079811_06280 [Scytonema sp. HK-05]|uniref:hypothetical protein n=1 Tax=Scytonema sp. HK-05 TaxID=1137095 RepID=UPI0009362B7A|nr:hypothetical protein [Scytonema sp. HK-05]OKH59872.1 hypothetical protein NIES2130_06830 [Scytonema sp. HK-05]BAY43050.1 hypothetical protein SAMD00079811_06280 [Scytonema sp. HK-05]